MIWTPRASTMQFRSRVNPRAHLQYAARSALYDCIFGHRVLMARDGKLDCA